jgi:hypothetical protein
MHTPPFVLAVSQNQADDFNASPSESYMRSGHMQGHSRSVTAASPCSGHLGRPEPPESPQWGNNPKIYRSGLVGRTVD